MKPRITLTLAVLFILTGQNAWASGWRKDNNELQIINKRLRGKVMDHTANHGVDNRILSRSLWQKRDLYVYLPPGFDPRECYPVILWLHGFGQDEQSFLQYVVPSLDDAIHRGNLPPVIVAAPDGSFNGEPTLNQPSTFFLNSQLGDYEDFVLNDVWDFVTGHYPIRPEREAHVLAGVSMGGFAAFNLGIRHRQCFGTIVGIHPLLNLRWVDTYGNYMADFDPYRWGWRTEFHKKEVVARFYGVGTVKAYQVFEPLFGSNDNAMVELSRENPIELIDRTRLCNGELNMFVGYGGKDEFNIDAQVESFLYLAHYRGLRVDVGYEPAGRHNAITAFRFFPCVATWLAPRLAPYCPPFIPDGRKPIVSVPLD